MKSGQINSFSLAEIFPVGDSFFHRFAAINGQVGKPPQTLRHTQRFRSNRLCVMSRNAINARLDLELRLRRKQRFHTRFLPSALTPPIMLEVGSASVSLCATRTTTVTSLA